MTRITNSMVMRSTLFDLNRSLTRLQDSQADLSTGKALRRISDDPVRALDAVSSRSELRRADQRTRTADDTAQWLRLADTALVSGLDLLSRAKELVVMASNGGAIDPAAQHAIATEMGAIREEMLALANTEFHGRSIFNGTAAGDAYDAAGAYLGNAASITREVAPGTTVAANVTGEQVFGSQAGPAGDLFAVLDRLATAIGSGDIAAIELEHVHLDDARDRLSTATADVGSRAARLESIRERATADEAATKERLSGIEDIDLAEALLAVQANENAYTAALQAAAKVIPVSLLDYLR